VAREHDGGARPSSLPGERAGQLPSSLLGRAGQRPSSLPGERAGQLPSSLPGERAGQLPSSMLGRAGSHDCGHMPRPAWEGNAEEGRRADRDMFLPLFIVVHINALLIFHCIITD